jgi:large subunit ribosomal protein L1
MSNKHNSKRLKSYKNALQDLSSNENNLISSIEHYKNFSAKFTESLQINFLFNKKNKNERSFVVLPHQISSKKKKILVITEDSNIDAAISFGAFEAGLDTVIDKLKNNSSFISDIDVIICTDDCLTKITSLARTLGPKGLMPSMKSGTVCSVNKLKETIDKFFAPLIDIKITRDNTFSCKFSNMSMTPVQITENLDTIVSHVKSKNTVDACSIASTMGFKYKLTI